MSEQSNIGTWPERIYLQSTDEPEPMPYDEAMRYEDVVTWCDVRQEQSDVDYVRADLAAVAVCQHRIVDARNALVKSGYFCPDCGALFAAGDHDAPAQPETWKVLPSPARVTGEILHQAFPEIPCEPWPSPAGRQAVWERFAERVNARLAATDDARDAARYRWLREKLTQSLCGGVEFNDEKLYYEQPVPGEEVRVYWYPDTPVGFYEIQGSDLDGVIDSGIEDDRPTGEPIQEAKEGGK